MHMEKASSPQESTEQRQLRYENEIFDIAQDYDVELPERAINLSIDLLEQMYQANGDESSETYKPYHNDQHAIDVIRRSFRLWNLLHRELPDKIGTDEYELLLIAAAGHDLVVGSGKEQGYDEYASGIIVAHSMQLAGYDKAQIVRVQSAIDATTVTRDSVGNITQDSMRSGDKDPIRLVLATADINGATMEGIPTLVENALGLYAEMTGELPESVDETSHGITEFLLSQAQFINGRLEAIQGDLEYYFSPEDARRIQAAYEKEFTGASRDVISLSKTIASFPEMAKMTVEKVTSALGASALKPIEKGLKAAFTRKKK